MSKNAISELRAEVPARNGHVALLPDAPRENPPGPEVDEVPPLSNEDLAALAEFEKRQQVLSDLTLGCIQRAHTGVYVSGPPGVSKSHTILKTLREKRADWQLHQRVTAKPLFLELQKAPGAVHLIEDCEQLFCERSALTLLRSALGGERVSGRKERKVCYSVAGANARELEFYFYGSIIVTSNRPLADEKPEVRAILSRMSAMEFAPPDNEIRAVMRQVARRGFTSEAGVMTPRECMAVIEYVFDQAAERECRLDLRWIERAYAHYLTHVASGGRVDWRDMVKFTMIKTLTYFEHPVETGGPAGPQATRNREALVRQVAIARRIAATPGLSDQDRMLMWERETELSRATYFRRLKAEVE